MAADLNPLLQMMQSDPSQAAMPAGGAAPLPPIDAMGNGMPVDPMMAGAAGMPGAGVPAPPAFGSTDPAMLAQVVQDALAQLAEQDHMMLESQQQQAAMQAAPLLDQMLMQAAMPAPDPMMGAAPMGAPDPAAAFGEGVMPPLPPEGLV